MIVIQRPAALVFAADCPDYIIDTDKTITFEVRFRGTVILSEDYSPDFAYQVRIRKLGRFLAKALWGDWAQGNVSYMDHLVGSFEFLIDGKLDSSSSVIFSRSSSRNPIGLAYPLSSVTEKVVKMDTPDYTSFYVKTKEVVYVVYTDSDGISEVRVPFYTHSGVDGVVTLDTSYQRVRDVIGSDVSLYKVGGMKIHVDKTSYIDRFVFRFKNRFDCTEVLVATGSLVQKMAANGRPAFMHGIERKFVDWRQDMFTVNSGVIFIQSDYRIWSDIINSQQVSVLVDGVFYDVIISDSNYERNFRKNVLKAVEFSFRFADPDNNGIL